MTTSSTHSHHTLSQALTMIEALVPLLLRSGIGYAEFASACKPIFYRQALIEADRTQQKTTDSSISLLSGLHRRDTASLRKAIAEDPALANPPISKPVSVPKQVVALWLSKNIDSCIPIFSEEDSVVSFAKLVQQVSKDQHFRSIVNELERQGIVAVSENMVTLKKNAYTPDPNVAEAKEIFSQNVADHISAGLLNLFASAEAGEKGVLEQAIFSDELSDHSIQELHQLANDLWFSTLDNILKKAIALHEADKQWFKQNPTANSNRFKLGMYAYNEPEDIKAGKQ